MKLAKVAMIHSQEDLAKFGHKLKYENNYLKIKFYTFG
jgi:hypothetical protein